MPRVSILHSLVLRFVKDQFDDYRESTIGGPSAASIFHCAVMNITCSAAFLTQTVTLEDQTTVKFEIWFVACSLFSPLPTYLWQGYCWSRKIQGRSSLTTQDATDTIQYSLVTRTYLSSLLKRVIHRPSTRRPCITEMPTVLSSSMISHSPPRSRKPEHGSVNCNVKPIPQ